MKDPLVNKKFPLLFLILVISISGLGFKNPTDFFSKTEAYFSPEGQIKERLIKAIQESKETIDIAIFNFTSHNLRTALVKAKKRGVKIRVITDAKEAQNDEHSLIPTLVQEGFEVRLLKKQGEGIMHDKFAVFDQKLLFTGSYNWTESAEKRNYENVLFIPNEEIIKKYEQEFERMWTAKN